MREDSQPGTNRVGVTAELVRLALARLDELAEPGDGRDDGGGLAQHGDVPPPLSDEVLELGGLGVRDDHQAIMDRDFDRPARQVGRDHGQDDARDQRDRQEPEEQAGRDAGAGERGESKVHARVDLCRGGRDRRRWGSIPGASLPVLASLGRLRGALRSFHSGVEGRVVVLGLAQVPPHRVYIPCRKASQSAGLRVIG